MLLLRLEFYRVMLSNQMDTLVWSIDVPMSEVHTPKTRLIYRYLVVMLRSSLAGQRNGQPIPLS